MRRHRRLGMLVTLATLALTLLCSGPLAGLAAMHSGASVSAHATAAVQAAALPPFTQHLAADCVDRAVIPIAPRAGKALGPALAAATSAAVTAGLVYRTACRHTTVPALPLSLVARSVQLQT